MSDEANHSPPLHVEATIAANKRSATIRFIEGEESQLFLLTADTRSIENVIEELGALRKEMEEPVPFDLPKGVHPLADVDPRWYVLPNSSNKYATLWVRHPGFGWSGYGFPRHEAGQIARWLRKVTTITSTRDTHSPSETSFGGNDNDFLITTGGLGFYYYGKGERRIGPNPFEQVEFDSDRAAGIVAGSILEQRLEEALLSRMRQDKPTIAVELFRPTGALGPFSTKIKLAYMLGFLSDAAYTDMDNLIKIRNDFAHRLDLDSFERPSIMDRCKNFKLVDGHIGPVLSMPADPVKDWPKLPEGKISPYRGLPDHAEKLADPRFRYVMTAQILGYLLGQSADHPKKALPLA